MVYTLGPTGEHRPPPFQGFRHFWQRSYRGVHLPDYEAGVALGAADMTDGGIAGQEALLAVISQQRDNAWEAQRDGYRDATRARGPSIFDPD